MNLVCFTPVYFLSFFTNRLKNWGLYFGLRASQFNSGLYCSECEKHIMDFLSVGYYLQKQDETCIKEIYENRMFVEKLHPLVASIQQLCLFINIIPFHKTRQNSQQN